MKRIQPLRLLCSWTQRYCVFDCTLKTVLLPSLFLVLCHAAYEYEGSIYPIVTEVKCQERNSTGEGEFLRALLKKPDGYKGHPLFADNRRIRAGTDEFCQIRPLTSDPTKMLYEMKVVDFAKCPVDKTHGLVSIRIWFPELDGVVRAHDQEVLIICKPPRPVITEMKTTGFAGGMPSTGRVSGIVEQAPSHLEYTLALYQESIPRSGFFDILVEDAVPIGTMMQLKATISNSSIWKFAKLTEVTISTDYQNPYAGGHVTLVRNGCRVKDFESIVPHHPRRSPETPGEVTLAFEAFLLENVGPSSQLWIHAEIKACLDLRDCLPEFCMGHRQPTGHGRKRRITNNTNEEFETLQRQPRFEKGFSSNIKSKVNRTKATVFGENLSVQVIAPSAFTSPEVKKEDEQCSAFVILTVVLSCLLLFVVTIASVLALRVKQALKESRSLPPTPNGNCQTMLKSPTQSTPPSGNDVEWQMKTIGTYDSTTPRTKHYRRM